MHHADRHVGAGGESERVVGAGVDDGADAGRRGAGDGHLDLAGFLDAYLVAGSGALDGDAGEAVRGDGRRGDHGSAIGLQRHDQRAFVDGDAGGDGQFVLIADFILAKGVCG